MIVGYVRVSTVEQCEDRQLVTMKKYNVERTFKEKVSAKDKNRPELQEMLKMIDNLYEYRKTLNEIKEDEPLLTVVIHDFSRLARSTKDLLEIVDYLNDRNVCLISAKENIDTSTPTGKLMLTMIGAINEFERTNLLERQREGIAIAKEKGKYKGRKKIPYPKNFEEIYKKWKCRELNGKEAMEQLGLKRTTFYQMIKDYEASK